MKSVTRIVLLLMLTAAGRSEAATTERRLILSVTDRATNSQILKSVYADIDSPTMTTIDPRCNSPEAVEIHGTYRKRVGNIYVKCTPPEVRQNMTLFTCDNLADNCRKIWNGERSEFEGFVSDRCERLDTPGVSDFVFGTTSYRLNPTVRDFCRNAISLAHINMSIVVNVESLQYQPVSEGIFPADEGTKDFFERLMGVK